ncbi:MAG: hypothetical protein NT126_09730 [Bacteroidetes bacterium]|nr:hypothetical protein [Bacteroidota bacterium]
MKIIFLALAGISFLAITATARCSENSALIQYHSFSAALNEKSDTLRRKYFYKYDLELKKDEVALIKYASLEYAVSIYARSTSGDTLGSIEIPKYYSDKGSHLAFLFKPADSGHFQILFTSKDSLEKGKFTVDYAIFNSSESAFDDNWEFCRKLDYIMQHSATDFQFIAGDNSKDFSLTNTRNTDVYLVTPSVCEIEYFTSDVYVCGILEKINLEKCHQKMKELDYEIKQCLSPSWKITEMKREDVRPLYRERFEKETDYILTGLAKGDMNEYHRDRNITYVVRLLVEKDLLSGYDLKIIIE